jgi:hypothetical protein
MNNATPYAIALSCLAFAGAVCAQQAEAPVAVNTDGMPHSLRARLEAKAQEGPTAVIRFINRTRNIHQLRAQDVIRPDRPEASASRESARSEVVAAAPPEKPRE